MKYLWYTFLGLFSLGCLGLVLGVGLFVYVVSNFSQDLPDYNQLKTYEPPIVTRLYAGDGQLMNEFAREKRVFMPVNAIPDHVKNAFISAEDSNFYTHHGVDPRAIARAIVTNLQNPGKRKGGASTITQQVAKNFLLTNEVSYTRKIREAILAYRMESTLSKDQLLELYLNEIYLGARAYGVAAAALNYFDKSLEELTIAEAAYLGALPKGPNNYHPIRKHDAAVERRNWVIGRMAIDGHIEEAQADLARVEPLDTVIKLEDDSIDAPYFGEEVRRILVDRYGEDSLYEGGLAVRTSLDPKLQGIAETAMRDGLMAYDKRWGYRGAVATLKDMNNWKRGLSDIKTPKGLLPSWGLAVVLDVSKDKASIGFKDGKRGTVALEDLKWARKSLQDGYALGAVIESAMNVLKSGDVVMVEKLKPENDGDTAYRLQQAPKIRGALIALDPHTGRILAMQGGWNYGYGVSEFNRATQAKRQPGSAFKPFVYLAALENGFTPATLVLDAPFVIEDRPGHFWRPSNYSKSYYGPTPIRVGVEKSKNLMTVRLADYIGMDVVTDYAQKFGISEDMPKHLANSLGAWETTVLDLTAAYGMIVNGGKKVTPTFIDRIQDRHGKTIFQHDERLCSNCGDLMRWEGQDVPDIPDMREQLIDERYAYQMTSILEGVIQRGTGVRIKDLGRPLGGKTGTTNESKDAWFIGFSPDLVVGVYAGYDDPRSLGKRETGSSVAVPIFKQFMKETLADQPFSPFRIPLGIRNVQINAKTGALARIGDSRVIWEAFVAGTEPSDDIFVLNPSAGINEVEAVSDYSGDSYGTFDPNAPFNPEAEQFDWDENPAQNSGGFEAPQVEAGQQPFSWDSNPQVAPENEATTGTGGFY